MEREPATPRPITQQSGIVPQLQYAHFLLRGEANVG